MRNAFVFIGPFLILLLGVGCGFVDLCGEGRVRSAARDLVGPDAIECAELACLVEAYQDGQEAWVEQSVPGVDSNLLEWWVATGDGELWVLYHDDYSTGDGGGWLCVDPVVQGDLIECTTREPVNNHYRICGSSSGQPQPIPWRDRP